MKVRFLCILGLIFKHRTNSHGYYKNKNRKIQVRENDWYEVVGLDDNWKKKIKTYAY